MTATGEKEVETTDVEKLIKEDEIAEQVHDFVKQDKDLKDHNATKVKTTEYEDTVKYEIELEKVVEDSEDDKKDVVEVVDKVVVHDKNTHENTVISESKKNKTKEDIATEHKEKEQKNKDEDVYVVVTKEEKEQLPEKVADAIDNIVEEVKEKNNFNDKDYEVEVLLEDEGETSKVKEIIKKKDGTENTIVTGVINEETGEHFILETKPADEKVLEHLKPKETKPEKEDKKPEEKPEEKPELTVVE